MWVRHDQTRWWKPDSYHGVRVQQSNGDVGAVDWQDRCKALEYVKAIAAAGIEGVILDLTNGSGWNPGGWVESTTRWMLDVCGERGIKVAVAISPREPANADAKARQIYDMFVKHQSPDGHCHYFRTDNLHGGTSGGSSSWIASDDDPYHNHDHHNYRDCDRSAGFVQTPARRDREEEFQCSARPSERSRAVSQTTSRAPGTSLAQMPVRATGSSAGARAGSGAVGGGTYVRPGVPSCPPPPSRPQPPSRPCVGGARSPMRPLLVCYCVRREYEQLLHLGLPHLSLFDLVWASGEDSARNKWGWGLEPWIGAVPSCRGAMFVTSNCRYGTRQDSPDWRKSITALDYGMAVAAECQPKYVIIGAYDDVPERNSWLVADTSAAQWEAIQVRDELGEISSDVLYRRIRDWCLHARTPQPRFPGGPLPDGPYFFVAPMPRQPPADEAARQSAWYVQQQQMQQLPYQQPGLLCEQASYSSTSSQPGYPPYPQCSHGDQQGFPIVSYGGAQQLQAQSSYGGSACPSPHMPYPYPNGPPGYSPYPGAGPEQSPPLPPPPPPPTCPVYPGAPPPPPAPPLGPAMSWSSVSSTSSSGTSGHGHAHPAYLPPPPPGCQGVPVRYLSAEARSGQVGQLVRLDRPRGDVTQLMWAYHVGDGAYRFVSVSTGLALEESCDRCIRLAPSSAAPTQRWILAGAEQAWVLMNAQTNCRLGARSDGYVFPKPIEDTDAVWYIQAKPQGYDPLGNLEQMKT